MMYKTPEQDHSSNESAYLLQWPGASPEEVLRVILQEHFAALLRFAQILQEQVVHSSAKDLVIKTVQTALTYQASQNGNAYHGQASVLAWLYQIMLKQVRDKKAFSFVRRSDFVASFPQLSIEDGETTSQSIGTDLDAAAQQLSSCPQTIALPALLRLMDGMQWADIVYILGLSSRKQKQVLSELLDWYGRLQNELSFASPVDVNERGKDENPLEPYADIETVLHQVVQGGLPRPTSNRAQEEEIIDKVLTAQTSSKVRPLINQRVSELGLLGILLVGLISGAYYMNQIFAAEEGSSLFPTPTSVTPLPELLTAERQQVTDTKPISPQLYIGESEISGNGQVIAYIAGLDDQPDFPGFSTRDLFIYDIHAGETQHLDPRRISANCQVWNGNPDIAQNGRWITFSARVLAKGVSEADHAQCLKEESFTAIYLYDRTDDVLQRVSENSQGEPADAESGFPTISPDGRRVFFWSWAENLVSTERPCVNGPGGCANLFIYRRLENEMQLLQIGRTDVEAAPLHPVRSTWNGDQFLLEIHATDMISLRTTLRFEIDTFLYSWDVQQFAPINLPHAFTGAANQPFLNADISLDGRFVAFVTSANNLSPADTNGLEDVYMMDRRYGYYVHLSKPEESSNDNKASGVRGSGERGGGPRISGNGNMVTFLSYNPDLADDRTPCEGTQDSECLYLYSFDWNLMQTTRWFTTNPMVSPIRSASISDDGYLVAAAAKQGPGCLLACTQIYLVEPPKIFSRLPRYEEVVLLANVAGSTGIDLPWNYEWFLEVYAHPVWAMAFSPDGKHLVSGAADGSIQFWNLDNMNTFVSMRQRRGSSPSTGGITAFAFSGDSRLLASSDQDGLVVVWRVEENQVSRFYSLENQGLPVKALAFSPDGRYLAIGTAEGVAIWEIAEAVARNIYQYPSPGVAFLSFSAEGGLLLTGLESSELRIWDFLERLRLGPNAPVSNAEIVHRLVVSHAPLAMSFDPRSGWLTTGSARRGLFIWQVQDGGGSANASTSTPSGQFYQLLYPANGLAIMASSPRDGWQRIAASDYSGRLLIYTLTPGRQVDTIQIMDRNFSVLAYDPNQQMLAAGGVDGTIYLLSKQPFNP